jgi:hypothetical protein
MYCFIIGTASLYVLLTKYYSSEQIKKNETGGACRALVGKLEEKRALGRARCTKKDNIKTDFQEV